MPASVINATINGANATGGNVAELELQVGGTTAITVNSAGYSILANPLPIASGGTGSNTGAFSGANLTSLNASSITSGTLAVARGGTGAATLDANNVILGNGTSAVQFVAPGTTGNLLTSNGSTWTSTAPAGGGGSVVFLGSAVAANSVVDFTGLNTTTYNSFLITFTDVRNNNGFAMRMYPGGTLATTGIYVYASAGISSGNTWVITSATSGSLNIILDSAALITANLGRTGYIHFFPAGGYSNINGMFNLLNSTTNVIPTMVSGFITNATEANGIRFLGSNNGNLLAGNFWLYGIKSS
jgi:hypothetical protein